MQFGSFCQHCFLATLKIFGKNFPRIQGHRNERSPVDKNVSYQDLNWYDVIVMPQLEADDAMGIYAKLTGNIIVSPDKDMRQIPGKLYNLEDTITITPEEGAKWHLIQTLAGDQTDGYSGVPGIGVKRTTTLFRERRLQLGYSCQSF